MDNQQENVEACEKWVNTPLWSLNEACEICIDGIDPDNGKTLLSEEEQKTERPVNSLLQQDSEDIRSDYQLFAGGITDIEADYDERLGEIEETIGIRYIYKDKEINITDLIKRHIAKGNLKPYSNCGTDQFDPKEIVLLLTKIISFELPQTLKEILLPKELQKSSPVSEAALKKAYKQHISNFESKLPTPTWKDDQNAMEEALGKKPTDKQIKQIRKELAPHHWKKRGRRSSP